MDSLLNPCSFNCKEFTMNNVISFQVAPLRHIPRSAKLLGLVFTSVWQWLGKPFNSITQAPSMTAQEARQLANQWAKFDPQAAADLRAAADRFEQENGLNS
jgi:hypothetical protein